MTILTPHRLTGTGRWRRAVVHAECTRAEVEHLAGLIDEFHPEIDVLSVAWPSHELRPVGSRVRARVTVQVHERDVARLGALLRERLERLPGCACA